mmetsp:Transcript_7540/g.11751  ORF Transcript_7540/g.11751 Transcript_7540/m.11751 type:complete len:152 (-) Transcript_7540:589-1044(-)
MAYIWTIVLLLACLLFPAKALNLVQLQRTNLHNSSLLAGGGAPSSDEAAKVNATALVEKKPRKSRGSAKKKKSGIAGKVKTLEELTGKIKVIEKKQEELKKAAEARKRDRTHIIKGIKGVEQAITSSEKKAKRREENQAIESGLKGIAEAV